MPGAKRKPNSNKEKPPKSGGAMRLLSFLLLAAVVGGGLAYGALKFLSPGIPAGAAPPVPTPAAVETLDLGDKVINLANGDSNRYLRVCVVLEYPQEKKLSAEIKTKQPLLTEKTLNVFRSKQAEEVLPVKNQEKIKEEILNAVNENLQEGKVTQVYFTDFLVQ